MSLKKYLTPKVIVERGEYVKDLDDNVFKVSDKTPTHDDDTVVKTNNRIQKTSKGLGGVELENIAQVISNTQDNRPQSADSYTAIDAAIGFTKDEASTFVKDKFGFKIKFKKKASPADIIDNTLSAVDKYKEKVKKARISIDPYGAATNEVHASILKTLPTLNDIFDTVFEEQESNKQGQPQDTAQVGIDNTYVAPNLKNKFLLKQKQDLNAAKTLDPKAERSFREKYGTSSHMFQMKHDPVYEKKILSEAKKNPEQVDYPRNNTNRKDYVHPNNAFMFPNLKGESQANMVNQTNEFIAGELAGALPGISNLKRIPSKTFFNKEKRDLINYYHKTLDNPKFLERLDDLGAQDLKVNEITFEDMGSHFNNLFNDINIDFNQIKDLKKLYNIDAKATLDHELGHAIQKRVKVLKNTGASPNNIRELLDVTSSQPTILDRALLNIKKLEGVPYYKNPNAVDNYLYFSEEVEPYAHAREFRSTMQSLGYIKDQFDEIPVHIVERFIKEHPENRIASFIDTKQPYNVRNFTNILNHMPSVAVGAGVAASQVDNKQQGGTLKGKLRPYPKMVGNRPMAVVDINKNKAVSVESIDKRTVSLDDIYDADSVKINGTNAKTFYKSKLNKYIK